jgi:hypothetical protein
MARYNTRDLNPRIDEVDLVLLAYMIREASPFYGETKVQKTSFLSELYLRDQGLSGPRFPFFRFKNGPFSKELPDALTALSNGSFIIQSSPLKLTVMGHELAELIDELKLIPENRALFETLDETLMHCQPRGGEQLMNEVYELEMRPERWSEKLKIKDIPQNTDLIVPATDRSLIIPRELIELITKELETSEDDVRRAAKEERPKLEEAFLRRIMRGDPPEP